MIGVNADNAGKTRKTTHLMTEAPIIVILVATIDSYGTSLSYVSLLMTAEIFKEIRNFSLSSRGAAFFVFCNQLSGSSLS